MNIAMILSGGVGKRFGADVPKQYQDLLGKPVVEYVINAAKSAASIDKIVVVCAENWKDWFEKYPVDICEGGSERNISFRNGLKFIKRRYDCKKIMVFDAMRPFVTTQLIDEYMSKLDEFDVVATCQRMSIRWVVLIFCIVTEADTIFYNLREHFALIWYMNISTRIVRL